MEIWIQLEPQKDIIITDLDAMAKVLNDSFLIHPINTQATLALGRIASLKIAILNKLDSDALTEMQNAADKTIAISPTMPQGVQVQILFRVPKESKYFWLSFILIYKNTKKSPTSNINII